MDTSLHMHTSRGKHNHSTTSSSSSTNVPAVYTNAHSQSGQIIHQIPAFPSHPWPGNAISLAGLSGIRNHSSGQMQEIPPGTHIVQASGSGPHIITASPSAILSLNMTPAGNLVATVPAAAAPQVQPDPNDANKWHITFTTPSSLENGEGEGSGKRKVRGVACTCPNCRDGEGRDIPSKKKLHACHIPGCNKVYGQTSHLRAHIRWHTGERPFVCNWLACGKRFTRSDELQRHRRSHTGEKGFQCPHCCKRFMKNDNLVKHIQTHQLDIGYRHQQSET